MSVRKILIVIAVLALAVALASAYAVYNMYRNRLSCTYITYINTTCGNGYCTFNIPVEPGKWYKIVNIICRGTGMLAIYYSTVGTSYMMVNGEDITVVIPSNMTTTLPVMHGGNYVIYIRTDMPIGRIVGIIKIVEVS